MKILFESLQSYLPLYLMTLCMMMLFLCSSMKNIHPVILGLIMLSYSILISINLNIFNKTSLYSMIMFLINIGGFLILFLYFNSFALNNKMIFKMHLFYMWIYKFIFLILILIMYIMKNNIFNIFLFLNKNLLEMNPLFNLITQYYVNKNINILYLEFHNLILRVFLLIYLLYTLIIIMKIIFYVNPKFLRQLTN